MKRFADWEKDFIRLAYPTAEVKDIADLLGRSTGTIFGYASKNGLSSPGRGRTLPENVGLTAQERTKQNERRVREKKKRLGKCASCSKQATKGVFCDECSARRRVKTNERRESLRVENKCIYCAKEIGDVRFSKCEKCRGRRSSKRNVTYYERKESGICAQCGKSETDNSIQCEACKEVAAQQEKVLRKKMKDAAYAAYGGYVCVCCGETNPLFLSIDHIDGDGNKHRRSMVGKHAKNVGASRDLYRWLMRNGYPPGFQILCMNCNVGKSRNGNVCPHVSQGDRDAKVSPIAWLWKLSS